MDTTLVPLDLTCLGSHNLTFNLSEWYNAQTDPSSVTYGQVIKKVYDELADAGFEFMEYDERGHILFNPVSGTDIVEDARLCFDFGTDDYYNVTSATDVDADVNSKLSDNDYICCRAYIYNKSSDKCTVALGRNTSVRGIGSIMYNTSVGSKYFGEWYSYVPGTSNRYGDIYIIAHQDVYNDMYFIGISMVASSSSQDSIRIPDGTVMSANKIIVSTIKRYMDDKTVPCIFETSSYQYAYCSMYIMLNSTSYTDNITSILLLYIYQYRRFNGLVLSQLMVNFNDQFYYSPSIFILNNTDFSHNLRDIKDDILNNGYSITIKNKKFKTIADYLDYTSSENFGAPFFLTA